MIQINSRTVFDTQKISPRQWVKEIPMKYNGDNEQVKLIWPATTSTVEINAIINALLKLMRP